MGMGVRIECVCGGGKRVLGVGKTVGVNVCSTPVLISDNWQYHMRERPDCSIIVMGRAPCPRLHTRVKLSK